MSLLSMLKNTFLRKDSEKDQEGPFDQLRAMWMIIPTAKRASYIRATGGVEEFIRLYPEATLEEVAGVRRAFDQDMVPALRIVPGGR